MLHMYFQATQLKELC